MPSKGRVPAVPHSDPRSVFSILPSSLLVIWWDMSKEAADPLRNGQLNSFYSSAPSLAISTLNRCCQQTGRQFKELQSVLDKHRKIMLCFSSPVRIQLPPKNVFHCSLLQFFLTLQTPTENGPCPPGVLQPSKDPELAGTSAWFLFCTKCRISLWYLLNNNHFVLFCLVPAASEVKVSQHFSQSIRQ